MTDVEGTTRDTIEESVSVEGIPIHIIDTAGIRNTDNKIEKIGIEKSRKMADEADLVIAIFDASKELDGEDEEILDLLKNKKSIVVLNKIDLPERKITVETIKEKTGKEEIVEISAKEYLGIEKIYNEIAKMFELNEINLDNSAIITNIRHKEIILNAIKETKKAQEVISQNMPIDIIGIYIKDIMEALGKITGESVSDEIIKEIFSKFCLGK